MEGFPFDKQSLPNGKEGFGYYKEALPCHKDDLAKAFAVFQNCCNLLDYRQLHTSFFGFCNTPKGYLTGVYFSPNFAA